MIQMWTFSNSTWKGQLKNVQDEISRPQGSREIQKTKVETVLLDTLYIYILQIYQYRFHQIIQKWTFLNSTRKGQLKNVQDGISRPLGSREIQKTKVETVLWDTLYFENYL